MREKGGGGGVQENWKFGFTHVAAWGNAVRTNMEDYVEIEQRPDSSLGYTGLCDVVGGVEYEVMYANFGALKNPQAKIIAAGARVRWCVLVWKI